MLQGVPTVYPNGVSNAALGSFAANFVPMPWPPQYYTWFSDFDSFDRALAATSLSDWSIAGTNAAIANSSVTDAFGGVVSIGTSGADNDQFVAQWAGSNSPTPGIAETFTFVPGKCLQFACRFQLSEATQSDFIIGLAVAAATPVSAVDGVYFLKADDAATLALVSSITGPTVLTKNVATIAAATWYELGFVYNGIDLISAYQGGNSDGTWNFVGSIGIGALPTTELAVTFGLQNGDGNARTALVDWIFASRER